MTQLLIQGSAILAQGPFEQNDDEIRTADAIYPKHVIEGWEIVDVSLPAGFSIGRYEYDPETQSCILSQSAQDDDVIAQIASLKDQITQIETANPATPRGQRELTLVVREMIKQLTGSYPDNYGFNKASDMETEIAALRAQIQALGG